MSAIIKAYCIIERGDKILLSEDVGKDGWKLPGGFVEEDELVRDAAVREVKEETGYEVELKSIICLHEYVKESGTHVVRFYFTANITGGAEKIMEGEVGRLKWIKKDKAKDFKEQDFFIKPYFLAIRDFLKNKTFPLDHFQSLSK